MKLIFSTASMLTLCLLAGCAQPPLIVAGQGDAVEPERVRIYYPDRPRCDFETLAHLQASGGYLSLQSMVSKMRQQAAEIGADGLYVVHTQRLDILEYVGTAKAIRCLPA